MARLSSQRFSERMVVDRKRARKISPRNSGGERRSGAGALEWPRVAQWYVAASTRYDKRSGRVGRCWRVNDGLVQTRETPRCGWIGFLKHGLIHLGYLNLVLGFHYCIEGELEVLREDIRDKGG